MFSRYEEVIENFKLNKLLRDEMLMLLIKQKCWYSRGLAGSSSISILLTVNYINWSFLCNFIAGPSRTKLERKKMLDQRHTKDLNCIKYHVCSSPQWKMSGKKFSTGERRIILYNTVSWECFFCFVTLRN